MFNVRLTCKLIYKSDLKKSDPNRGPARRVGHPVGYSHPRARCPNLPKGTAAEQACRQPDESLTTGASLPEVTGD